jgi:transcriptional regulator with XRE-family HTH domain
MDYAKEIGTRIFKARQKFKGLSQAKLAEKTNGLLTKAAIGNYEQGTRTPGVAEIICLAKILEESPAYLMCLDEPVEVKQPEPTEEQKRELELLENWRKLPSGWKYYVFKKTEQLRAITEKLPVYLRDSIKPITEDSVYWEWEKQFEQNLRSGEVDVQIGQNNRWQSIKPKEVEPPLPDENNKNQGKK